MKDLTSILINNKYQLGKRIGSGSYGIVYSAQHIHTGVSYAIKIILKNNSTNTSNNKQLLVELEKNLIYQALINNGQLNANLLNLDTIEQHGASCKFLREISLQLKVHKHPNILSIYKVYDFFNAIFVVMDYYPEGDLFATIVDKQRYKDDPFLIKSVFIQMVDAINYCHSKNVYHCDLKPENVLVANNGTRMILADFGLALQEEYIESNISCGSSYYMSPERIQNFSQGFNTLESHSIHLERLLHPDQNKGGYPQHGNVKFPTSAGDVWSLAIILINLISIRNPWLKASFHDPTFKAFVSSRKILMKILPISFEVFTILGKYLSLNPWERGSLFEFRFDILRCHQFTDTGPLSVESSIEAMDIITTESQMNPNLEAFTLCPIPVDHVALQRQKSKETTLDSMEVENDYMPKVTRENDFNILNSGIQNTKKECGNCADCGFGYDFDNCFTSGAQESGSSTMTTSTSFSNYANTPTSEYISVPGKTNNLLAHEVQLQEQKRKTQELAHRQYLERQYAQQQQRQQLLQQRQQEQLLLQQQQQQQQQILQQQSQKENNKHGNILSKLFKHSPQNRPHHNATHQVSPVAQKRVYPQPGMSQYHQEVLSGLTKPEKTEFQNVFPMPGMGHNVKPILGQGESRRKKFVTKRRQRRVTKSNPSPKISSSENSSISKLKDKQDKRSPNSESSLNTLTGQEPLNSEDINNYSEPCDDSVNKVSQHFSTVSIDSDM